MLFPQLLLTLLLLVVCSFAPGFFFVRRLRWKGPTYRISGVTKQGTKELMQDVMRLIEETAAPAREGDGA